MLSRSWARLGIRVVPFMIALRSERPRIWCPFVCRRADGEDGVCGVLQRLLAGVCWFSWDSCDGCGGRRIESETAATPCDGTGRRRATRKVLVSEKGLSGQERLNAPVSFLMKSPMPYATGFKWSLWLFGNRGGKLRYRTHGTAAPQTPTEWFAEMLESRNSL